MSVSFIEPFALSWEIGCDSMGNSYCQKNYSKGEVNLVENTKIRLRKMKKNVAMASFYCLVSKIWKKKSILCCNKKGKSA